MAGEERARISWPLRLGSFFLALTVGGLVFAVVVPLTFAILSEYKSTPERANVFGDFTVHFGWVLMEVGMMAAFLPALVGSWVVFRSGTVRLRNFVVAGMMAASIPLAGLLIATSAPDPIAQVSIAIFAGPATLLAGALGGAGAWHFLRWKGAFPT